MKGWKYIALYFLSVSLRKGSPFLRADVLSIFALSKSPTRRNLLLEAHTIEYSFNFRRHVVFEDDGGKERRVTRSFLWLDDAVKCYPKASILPVFEETAIAGVNDNGKIYPTRCILSVEDNLKEIKQLFQTRLGLFPKQADRVLQDCKVLPSIPVDIVAERIEFLLHPLPFFNSSSYSYDTIDWPVQFHRYGRGAGMSLAQVTHALQTLLPEMLLVDDLLGTDEEPSLLPFLYEQTPTVIMNMARQQLDPLLIGTSHLSCAALSFLHWKGWEWVQCRVVMDALYCFSSLPRGPSWDIDRWNRDTMLYLSARLQLRPWQIHAMLKTHPQLATYSVDLVQRSIDALSNVGSLSIVQRLVLKMPSLLGMAVPSIQARLNFWQNQVGLRPTDLKRAVTTQPALLQYGLDDNLVPKLSFFCDELGIAADDNLIRMTLTYPDIWGRSLSNHYHPLVKSFCDRCNLTSIEFGALAVRAPLLLKSHRRTLETKLDFLQSRLKLNDEELKSLVTNSPMVLMQSMDKVENKVRLLEKTLLSNGRVAVLRNPSLLLNAQSTLEQRLERTNSTQTLMRIIGGRSRVSAGTKSTRSRSVYLVVNGNVEKAFENVKDAAEHAGVSRSSMYRILRRTTDSQSKDEGYIYRYAGDVDILPLLSSRSLPVATMNEAVSLTATTSQDAESNRPTAQLVIYTTGRVYPTETTIRGHRRGGGMALYIPNWDNQRWREIGMKVWKAERSNMKLLKDGTLLIGYPFFKPSRTRCSLYVCREALRVAAQTSVSEIIVVTDSNVVADLLANSSQLVEWGRTVDGKERSYVPNVDIMYPLARTVYSLAIKNVSVSFESLTDHSQNYTMLSWGAQLAAKRMYDFSVT